MNCSEFDSELESLVEVRGERLSDVAASHVADCANCRQLWRDHRLLESALAEWRPVQCPSLVESVLKDLCEAQTPLALGGTRPRDTRWVAVAAAAVCLVAVLGLSLSSRPGSVESNFAGPSARSSRPDAKQPPIEVAASVAAVLDDLHSEYSVLAAETSATARELADALPATPSTWDGGFSVVATTPVDAQEPTQDTPPGAVSVIGRSFGDQIGQAMGFLRVAVPDAVPRG